MTTENEEDLVEIEQPEPPEVEIEVEGHPEENPAVQALKEQVERLEADRQRDFRARQDAERRAASAEAEATDTRLSAIDTALDAKKRQQEDLERDFKTAMEDADYGTGRAKLQTKIAETVRSVGDLENGKVELERQKAEPRQQRAEVSDPVEAYIAQQSPRTQDYLRKHRELATDEKKNREAVALHSLATSRGIQPDSDAYFEFMDQHLGYAAKPEADNRSRTAPAAPVQRASAPVSRGGREALPRLTASEAQTADALGISRAEYAKRKLEMGKPNWNGPRFNDGYYQ